MWIDLGRVLVPADNPGEVPSRNAWFYARQPHLSWDDALTQPCVVVLGEAGTGKTAELRGQADRLTGQGKAAFFLPVETLAQDGASMAIDGDHDAFERWKEGTQEGWFFLDSVDEAKLHQQTLHRAIRKLEADVRGAICRCHVIVSCRHSDWREEDKETLERLSPKLITLPTPNPAEKERARVALHYRLPDAPLQILQLAPLNWDQIQSYAVKKAGLSDVGPFMQALGRADLWGLAGRPLDVDWLAVYWRNHQQFGSLREMIEENIVDKLCERRQPDQFSASLPLKRAREAVERIALAMSMTGADSVALLGADTQTASGALNARVLLDGYDGKEISSLLRLPIFDPATLGRVRFHHRMAREYLAASCLRGLGQAEPSVQRLHELVFAEKAGRSFVRPGFEAIVAWLALDDAEVRRRAVTLAPEHLMDLGDPAGLPLDTRRDVLHAYVERYEGRTRTMHHFDGAGLERFAGEELVEDFRRLLVSAKAEELRGAILEMVERKKLGALVDVVLDVVEEPALSSSLRYRAIRAIAKAGTMEEKRALAKRLVPVYARDRDTASALLDHLTADVLTTEQVVEILGRARVRENFFDGYSTTLDHLYDKCSQEVRAALLPGLISLSGRVLGKRGALEWAPLVVPLLDDALRDGRADDSMLVACMPILEKARDSVHHLGTEGGLFCGKMALRRALFWHSVERGRPKKKGERLTDANAVWPHFWFQPAPEDAAWLEVDALTARDVVARLLAFDGLLLLCRWGRLPLEGVRRVAAEREELGRRLERTLRRLGNIAHDSGALRMLQRRSHCDASRRKQKEEQKQEQEREELRRLLPEVRSGSATVALCHLYDAGIDDRASGHWSADRLADKYGSEIAQGALDGMRRFWEVNSPPDPADTAPNELPYVGLLGHLSVGLAVEGGLDIGSLDEMRLRKIVMYSIWNSNGLLPWLDACARKDPRVVRELLAPILRREWGLEHARVLSKLASASEVVRLAVAPAVLGLLGEAEPSHDQCLRECLTTLNGLRSYATEVLSLCRNRCVASAGAPKRFALWWATWLAVDASSAVSAIREEVSHKLPLEVADSCVLAVLAGRSWDWLVGYLGGRPAELLVLLDVVLRHVRFEDDDKGFRSPRHDAQEVRWRLIAAVAETGADEAIRALDDLAAHPWGNEFWPNWFKHSAENCALRAAMRTWSLREVVVFLDNAAQPMPAIASLIAPAAPSGGQSATFPISYSTMTATSSTILHLSDLHFGTPADATRWSSQLAADLREQGVTTLDALILSGDITDRSDPEQYKAARAFLAQLVTEYPVTPQQIIPVPGNHDLSRTLGEAAYQLRHRKDFVSLPPEGTFIEHGTDVLGVRDDALYQKRFDPFAAFYKDLRGESYPLEYDGQGLLYHLPTQGLLILGLNSAWEIDHKYTARASIRIGALASALTQIRQNPEYDRAPLKIAVWHHPINSPFDDRIKDAAFLQQLAKAGFRLALHGHIHKAETGLFQYDRTVDGRRIDLIGAGTFGAPVPQWTSGYPLQYNLLRIEGGTLTVHTRCRRELNGAWTPDAIWPQGPGKDPLPRYTIELLVP